MSSVGQQMLLVSGNAPATITYIGLTTIAGTTDSVSQPGVPIGTPRGDRYVFISTLWASDVAAALASASIGGITAKIHVNNGTGVGSGSVLGAAIISALVPTGTTATVVLNFVAGAAFHHPFLETYNVTGIISDIPIDTISADPLAVQPYADVIDVKKNGIMLLGASAYSAAAGYSMTGVTQDYDDIQGGSNQSVGGSLAVSADEVNHAVSISRFGGSGSAFNAAVAAASFR